MTKRLFDLVLALIALIVLAPVMAVVAWQVRRRLGSPVLFVQFRPGRHARPFKLIKFRTMSNTVAADGSRLNDDLRLTAFGRALRATSLDELPELWNVLRGDMSLVGPRPLLMEYLPLYTVAQARRHEVRPGITGWAQVNGRNSLSWDDKFDLDVWYVDHQTFWLDLRILLLTVRQVLRRDGITAEGQATMTRFNGTTST